MNKDNLEEQVNKEIIPSNYTWASYTKYNKLKETAQTVLDEENQMFHLIKDILKVELTIFT